MTRVFLEQQLPVAGELDIQDSQQLHYLKNVLRLQANDFLQVFGTCGCEYNARVVSIQRHCITVTLQGEITTVVESPIYTHIGQAISSGQRMDYSIQKATELGVRAITPLVTEHARSLSGARGIDKRNHWAAVANHAAQQCGRRYIPEIYSVQSLQSWLAGCEEHVRLIMHESCGQSVFAQLAQKPKSVAVLIGPEGGLSEAEVALASRYTFVPVQLGPRVLRTETAAPVVLALIQSYWGDFHG